MLDMIKISQLKKNIVMNIKKKQRDKKKGNAENSKSLLTC